MSKITFILGGAASGKSQYAENQANEYSKKIYIATAENRVIGKDDEFKERIRQHQQRRTEAWETLEVPLDLAAALNTLKNTDIPQSAVLIDCMTLWLSNLMMAERAIEDETATLITALKQANHDIFLVSNEVGHGIVPDNALARQFRDAQGRLNQALAKVATTVVFVTAGCPMILKDKEA